MSLSEREPNAGAVVLARKAEDDAKAMQLLARNREISDEIIGFAGAPDRARRLNARGAS